MPTGGKASYAGFSAALFPNTAWVSDGVARKDGNANLIRSFTKDVLPVIGQQPVKDLTEHDSRKVYKTLLERGVERTVVALANDRVKCCGWQRIVDRGEHC